MRNGLFLLIIFSLSLVSPVLAQPEGKFLSKEIKVGKPVQYALSYRHDPRLDVFFPDSTYDFTPFQFLKRDYYSTRTNASGSLDSVVYTLVSFEVDSMQYLKLPVYVMNQKDCTALYSGLQSIPLRSLLNLKSKKAGLQSNTALVLLDDQINYPLYFIILIFAGILGGLIYWLFGARIRRRWRQFQLWRRHLEFRGNFQRHLRGATDSRQAVINVERAVVLWKRYLERLEGKPYTTFTTKETVEQFSHSRQLEQALRETDAVVYGGVTSPQTQESLRILRDLAVRTYIKQREVILEKKS
ncbi:LapA family protein [Siphonobacter sp. SORGH_AS_1065]|uniref:LapA family protein n=1 Tax=Siphonobacter sp. SORGH_AS_1065 TaxID=3041795 RepID=UPI00278713C5|nr:LapA family protein [Siphonobacter sp. SORGH_AS_1065]MDQ1087834.1 hypothetical protein [Siphonobacter sp. SORGH_AS_1065]